MEDTADFDPSGIPVVGLYGKFTGDEVNGVCMTGGFGISLNKVESLQMLQAKNTRGQDKKVFQIKALDSKDAYRIWSDDKKTIPLYQELGNLIKMYREKSENEIKKVPNIQNLVKKFIATQLKDIQQKLPGIPSSQVDAFIYKLLKEKLPLFLTALDNLGPSARPKNVPPPERVRVLQTMVFAESATIRKDLTDLLRNIEQKQQVEKQKQISVPSIWRGNIRYRGRGRNLDIENPCRGD